MSTIKYPMFWPHIPDRGRLFAELEDTLSTRWIGQGPKVQKMEERYKALTGAGACLFTNSGTAALHLAYMVGGIGEKSSGYGYVIAPVFTCSATNHALLYQDASILFNDVCPRTLSSNVDHARFLSEKWEPIKAIVAVHIGGMPCDVKGFIELGMELGVPVIFDAAQALGAEVDGHDVSHSLNCGFATCHSFQAIKHITTGDGGMLVLKEEDGIYERAKRLRWFGIDREAREKEHDWQPWKNRAVTVNQYEVGYKYQPTDLDACWGIVGLSELPMVVAHRRLLARLYDQELANVGGIQPVAGEWNGRKSSYSLYAVLVERRDDFARAMLDRGVETNVVQLRNDRYHLFEQFKKRGRLPIMDSVEEEYLYLPINMKMNPEGVREICEAIKQGW